MVVVNGEERDDIAAPLTVRQLLDALDVDEDARGVAVAVEGGVVPRGEWQATTVPAGARVEVLIAVQGG